MFLKDEDLVLSPHLNYEAIEGLSSEVREKLSRLRPTSIVSLDFNFIRFRPHVVNLCTGCGEKDGGNDTNKSSCIA